MRKEIWAHHLLAFNLIRTLLANAAKNRRITLRSISFKCALQTLSAYRDALLLANDEQFEILFDDLLAAIAQTESNHAR